MKALSELYGRISGSSLYATIFIAIVCLATFGVTIGNNYNLDDNLVTQNHRLTSKGIIAIPEIYNSPYYQDDMGYSYGYRPTTLASFAIEKQLFGESARVSHTVNLLLYLATCVLAFLLIARIFPDKKGMALFAALLFTVHPLHTEVVASIKNRDEILSLLFAMLGCFVLIRPKRWFLALPVAATLLFLSVTSKMSAVNFILLLALIPAYPKPFFKDIALLILYGASLFFVFEGRDVVNDNQLRNILAISSLFLLVRLWYYNRFWEFLKDKSSQLREAKIARVLTKSRIITLIVATTFLGVVLTLSIRDTQTPLPQKAADFIQENSHKPTMERWSAKGIHSWKRPFDFVEHPLSPFGPQGMKYGTAASTLNRYLGKLFVPYPLAYYYGYNEVKIYNLLSPRSLFSILIHFGLFAIVLFTRTKQPAISIGILLYLTSITLFSGLVEIVAGMYADRFSYVASFGFCLAFAATTTLGFEKIPKKYSRVIAGLMSVFLIIFAAHSIHRNLLWKDEVTLMRHDIADVPNSAQAHNLLSHAIMKSVFKDGSFMQNEVVLVEEARDHFHRAVEIYPEFFNVWVDLGKVYNLLGQPELAKNANIRALQLDSTYTPLLVDLALYHESLGQMEEVIDYYRKYARLNPSFDAYDKLARTLYQSGRLEESRDVCLQYLQIEPSNAAFLQNLKVVEAALNDKKQVIN